MNLPDLPPDIRFDPLPQTEEAFDYAFAVKRLAMGPHITARWGWDEEFQRRFHQQRFREKPFLRVLHGDVPVGAFAHSLPRSYPARRLLPSAGPPAPRAWNTHPQALPVRG